jgi:hypothetical protein
VAFTATADIIGVTRPEATVFFKTNSPNMGDSSRR